MMASDNDIVKSSTTLLLHKFSVTCYSLHNDLVRRYYLVREGVTAAATAIYPKHSGQNRYERL
jgi:hypothetical protein